ncbi:hypothetical protein GBA52_007941 [Prunus armeniaca]|nr:hypothetical protein GBA52_007941 [Prunus armeniaca]
MRATIAAAASSSSCWSSRGMNCLHSNSSLLVFVHDYFAFFHLQSSKPIKSKSPRSCDHGLNYKPKSHPSHTPYTPNGSPT